jgi:hypothetical protein
MTLINTLTQETQGLKADFLAKTEKYCNVYFDQCLKRYHFNEQNWCELLGVTAEVRQTTNICGVKIGDDKICFPKGFFKRAISIMKEGIFYLNFFILTE